MAQKQSDEELMTSYQQGNFEAFEMLYGRYSGKVYGFLRKRIPNGLVDDVFQSVFMKLHEARGQYKKNLRFAPWLFVITRTTMLDHLRKVKRQTAEILSEHFDVAIETNAEPPSIDSKHLQNLTDTQKKILDLRYSQDQEFEEIAGHLNMSEQNIRQQVSRAVRKLRKLVGSEK